MSQSPQPPPSVSSQWRLLPTKPGIYIFKDKKEQILYVGKAKSLRDRVSDYFAPSSQIGPKTAALVSGIAAIDHIEVASELEALLLESKLIKRFRPPYNLASKDDKSPYYISLTSEEFPRPVINHQPKGALAGPFINSLVPRRILRQFRRVAPFCSASRPVRHPCLHSHLGLCSPCPAVNDRIGYAKNISRLKSLLRGRFKSVLSALKKDMVRCSRAQKYEQAGQTKLQIEALNYLLRPPIPPEEYLLNPNLAADIRQETLTALKSALGSKNLKLSQLSRIEMYDISSLSGASAAGAMTVCVDGDLAPGQYRHFIIRSASGFDDVSMLREILTRRLKRADWPRPDLIVLDGGPSQLSIVYWDIPTISLAKKQEVIYFPGGQSLTLPRSHPGLKLLQKLRDEAHRFSRRLHHKRRARSLVLGIK